MTQQETKAVEGAANEQAPTDGYVCFNYSDADIWKEGFIKGAQFLDELRKPSEPERGITITSVGEAGEELVEKIEEILQKSDGNLHWLTYNKVATEIAALMQPDKELLDMLKEITNAVMKFSLDTQRYSIGMEGKLFALFGDLNAPALKAQQTISDYEKQNK